MRKVSGCVASYWRYLVRSEIVVPWASSASNPRGVRIMPHLNLISAGGGGAPYKPPVEVTVRHTDNRGDSIPNRPAFWR